MKKQIISIPVHHNAKVMAVLIAIATVPFIFLMLMFTAIASPQAVGGLFILLFFAPIFYFVFAYISFSIICTIYNKIQRNIGGFVVEINDIESENT